MGPCTPIVDVCCVGGVGPIHLLWMYVVLVGWGLVHLLWMYVVLVGWGLYTYCGCMLCWWGGAYTPIEDVYTLYVVLVGWGLVHYSYIYTYCGCMLYW